MGLNPTGYVLRGAQVAPGNASSTAAPSTGVVRFPKPVPNSYTLKTSGGALGRPPAFVDASADQYRAAILEAPGSTPVEYLVWAANTSQLALSDDTNWWTELGTGIIPQGTLTVTDTVFGGDRTDGTDTVVVTDNGNKDLSTIIAIVVARGDQSYDDEGWTDVNDPAMGREGPAPYLVFFPDDTYAANGIATLSAADLTTLAGGLSQERGDQIITVRYTVAPAAFWWTRNDRYSARFGWSAKDRRWAPWMGSAAVNVGRLLFNDSYRLIPKLPLLPLGSYLPGDPNTPDAYATVRVGTGAGALSTPVGGIKVVSDAQAEAFDFTTYPEVAVVGQGSGVIAFNPTYIAQYAGQNLWYSPSSFQSTSTGVAGKMLDANTYPLYIAPIPGPTDYPFIRFGSRRPLTPTLVVDESTLVAATDPSPGAVLIARSTGRLRFNPMDLLAADPTSSSFDKNFYNEDVIYAGVALNAIPQPVRPAVQLVDGSGNPGTGLSDELYIPNGVALPGLGVSGVIDAPDGTGALPDLAGTEASVRPGGDDLNAQTTGRIRAIRDGVGDAFIFSRDGAITTLKEVNLNSDLSTFHFRVDAGAAEVAREPSAYGSRVMLSDTDLARFGDFPVYFRQASFTPSTYTATARVTSRVTRIFRFTGSEMFYFAVDGTAYSWDPTILIAANPTATYFTPEQVADSINADSSPAVPANTAVAEDNYLALEGATSVEIGFGTSAVKDLSGCIALGFLPGWRAVTGSDNWLPDSGASLGLFRSPVNLDRSASTPDFAAVGRYDDEPLVASVSGMPYVFLDAVPLQDYAGYSEGVFFTLTTTLTDGEDVKVIQKPLVHYEDVIHKFAQRRFDWVASDTVQAEVAQATSTLALGNANVAPESLSGVPGIPGGLYISEDGQGAVLQDPVTDFILPQDGIPGTALLVERFGAVVGSGAQGYGTAGSTVFTEASSGFSNLTISAGYRLKVLSGDNAGSYTILTGGPSQLTVTPAFPATDTLPVTWEVHTGIESSVYDPSLVADMSYDNFNHLPSEPFQVRLLQSLGVVTSGQTPTINLAGAAGHIINLRFGLAAPTVANTVSLVALGTEELGVVGGVLDIPDTGSLRFAASAFDVQIGATTYTPVGVPTFTGNPDLVEYLTAVSGDDPIGRIAIGSNLVSAAAKAAVYYRETFLPAVDLVAGLAEYDLNTGAVNLSATDLTNHNGEKLYFVRTLITENRLDVAISPMLGAFTLSTPAAVGTVVEVEYWRADVEGRRIGDAITEFLPVFISRQTATLESAGVYKFNAALDTVDTRTDPMVWVENVQQNFGKLDYRIDYPATWGGAGRITFLNPPALSNTVSITFPVFEARGGERAFNASNRPLYRPPFYIKSEQNQFGVRGNRVSEFIPGQVLRIGQDCFYVRSLTYYPTNDITAVGIFPTTVTEVGSRSPANDILSLISAGPVTTVVDPDGASPVATTAPAGFMSVIDTVLFPFEPISRGQRYVVFRGDLTQFAIPGHLLEIAGQPYTVTKAELLDSGARTKVSVTGTFINGIAADDGATVKLSYRPVYPPDSTSFLGCGQTLASETVELVLYHESDPGLTLIPEVDYHLDPASGKVTLLGSPLGSGDKLALSFTRLRTLKPFMQNGVVIRPRYDTTYLHTILPDAQNGLLGAQVNASYTFANPDSFYFRAVKFTQYLGEVAKQAVQDITSQSPASGAIKTSGQTTANWDQGRVGLLGERSNLTDKDRAARTFLTFYNDVVGAFEQILEAISGGFIGDHDHKFRFFVGTGKDYPTPGYEDAISGILSPRNIWNEVINSQRVGQSVYLTLEDIVVTPDSISIANGVLDGDRFDANVLDSSITSQKDLIKNDVDDVALIREGDVSAFLWFFNMEAQGVYSRVVGPHRLSRLFPTTTKAFLRLGPGAGAVLAAPPAFDPGIYTYGEVLDGKMVSTHGQQIGQLSNPSVGDITQVSGAILGKRRAKTWVWGYYPNGIPADSVITGQAAITDPCIIALSVPLAEVPLNAKGFPDANKLLSQGGVVPDAETGHAERFLPGFVSWDGVSPNPVEPGDTLYFGKPDGDEWRLCAATAYDISGTPYDYVSLNVRDIQYGCIIRFKLDLSAATGVSNPANVLISTGPLQGNLLSTVAEQGDTLFAGPPQGPGILTVDLGVAQTPNKMAAILNGTDTYKMGKDIGVGADGRLTDITDYWLLQFFNGQKPPEPMSAIEGPVEFAYTSTNPLLIPALEGLTLDDSGDIRIPYLKSGNTELTRFSQAQTGTGLIMSATGGGDYVYPDEILATDVVVTDAALSSPTIDMLPVTNGSTDMGIGDLRAFDFVLVQAPQTAAGTFMGPGATVSPQGFLTVGAVTSSAGGPSYIEPPRFVTATKGPVLPGSTPTTDDPIRYKLDNAIVHLCTLPYPAAPQTTPGATSGCVLSEDTSIPETLLDFNTTAIHFNSGAAGVGNFNELVVAGRQGKITLHLFALPDPVITLPVGPPALPSATGGVEALRIVIEGLTVKAYDYRDGFVAATTVVCGTPVLFGSGGPTDKTILIPATGLIPWAGAPPRLQWFLPHTLVGTIYTMVYAFEVVIDIDYQTSTEPGGTAYISSDRLTFNECIDLAHAQPRGTMHPIDPSPNYAQRELQAELTVNAVTTSTASLATGAGTAAGFVFTPTVPLGWTINAYAGWTFRQGTTDFTVASNTAVDLTVTAGAPVNGTGTLFALNLSTVNAYTNGLDGGSNPIPYTFLLRSGQSEIGTWANRNVGVTPERGTLKVMGFEGFDNTPITATDAIVSAVPSCDNIIATGTSPIFTGTGKTGSRYNGSYTSASDQFRLDSRVIELTTLTGSPANVVKGDIVAITASDNSGHPASNQIGTQIVRHSVVPTSGKVYREVSPETVLGEGEGWVPFRFPTLISYNTGTNLLTTSDAAPVTGGPLAGTTGFPVAPARIYIIIKPQDLASSDETKFRNAVVSAEYSLLTVAANGNGRFTISDWRDAFGTAMLEADFAALLQPGLLVSGMTFLPVLVSGAAYGLPGDNTVGYDHDTVVDAENAVFGFRRVTLTPPSKVPGLPLDFIASTPVGGVIDAGTHDGTIKKPATGGTVSVEATAPSYNHIFNPSVTTPVYHWVVHHIDFSSVPNGKWDKLNISASSYGAGTGMVRCLLPGSGIKLLGPDAGGIIQPGFFAQGGIFFEPSVPRASINLLTTTGGAHARVVDADHSLPDPNATAFDWERELGSRDGSNYYASGINVTNPESVTFEVRRIRRFHDSVLAGNGLKALQYAYEIRRGRVTDYVVDAKQVGTVSALNFVMDWATLNPLPHTADVWNDGLTYSGTNLGFFNDPDVNIHPGDMFRLLDDDGSLVEEVEILSVGSDTIRLVAPGITAVSAAAMYANGGMRFEVWIKQAPVPHEQSNEQLLALVTDRVVLSTDADWGAVSEKGGYVPTGTYATSKNKLYDDLNADGSTTAETFSALGVKVGDIVIVDPVGTIPQKGGLPATRELGSRPLGDNAVAARAAYIAGGPSLLDDNRGFYRVTKVVDSPTPHLEVSGATAFTGDNGSPVIFDSTDATRAYAVYPDIHASVLTGGTEGQMDLRPTQVRNAGTGKFIAGGGNSIRPFSYRIIRPSSLFKAETVDLVLSTRERMLSLIEAIRRVGFSKLGTYFLFQRDTHIAILGSLTDPDLGLGYMSNAYLTSIVGNVDVVPFANNSGCLSILDRRFWIFDPMLDELTYDTGISMKPTPPGTPYTEYETTVGGKVRPVLPDLINLTLDSNDRFRPLRYVWLAYRVHRTRGTLAAIERFDQELPERLAEQERLILQELSMESVT